MEDQTQKPLKNIFCAKCQEVTPHTGRVDGNGEYVFECQAQAKDELGNLLVDVNNSPVMCDRFIKLPADHPVEHFDAHFDRHMEHNIGQVSVEAQEKKLDMIMSGMAAQEPLPERVEPEPDETTPQDQTQGQTEE